MKSYITILVAVLFVSCSYLPCFAACPSADLTGDCVVDFKDFAKFAEQWLNEGEPYPILNGMTWVSINDPGIGGGHEGFTGEMGKYETTNAQYCEFLNAALASGDITVSGDIVYGANGTITAGQILLVRCIMTSQILAILAMESSTAGLQELITAAARSPLIAALKTIL